MYRSCIFCSASLGSNEVVEHFPVGRSVAFDAGRGRLWAVCRACGRWNLAPLEERWEVVEEAERAFHDARLRVQSENIGLARLPDGTRLVRVGDAVPGELAAWRYGSQLVQRRRRYLLAGAAVTTAGAVAIGGLIALQVAGAMGGLWAALAANWEERRMKKVLYRVSAGESPTGAELRVRRWHILGSRLTEGETGIGILVPDLHLVKRPVDGWGKAKYSATNDVRLDGAQARAALARGMVAVNHKGASHGRVREALGLLEDARSAEAYLRDLARRGGVLGKRPGMENDQLLPVGSLALEMALHEEDERRALEGELAELEAQWRQAEEIAAIADRLPDLPPPEPPRL